MASIKIFGFGDRLIAEYKNISNQKVRELHKFYIDEGYAYSIERNFDREYNNKQPIIMEKTITYRVKKDFPPLGLVCGQTFTVKRDSSETDFFVKNAEYFEVEIPLENQWKVGDAVIMNGMFTPKSLDKNKSFIKNRDELYGKYGHITEILHKEGTDTCNIIIKGDNGKEYELRDIYMDAISFEEVPEGKVPTIKRVQEYWFINSRGDISRDYEGRDYGAERWRKASSNYYADKVLAQAERNRILANYKLIYDDRK